ncbi:gastrula zinc finger protein XlCGF8.2DB [Drosophila ficusphila]|uniref:gastrula zinc finger protein XlCGF8.2DB n=1 Tax=Drosophila ficusphila TaxID=30025 RepID=UPI0007E5E774|nr:gastrula zinc finger protein XlCGF8.2DB [Drosophila ficusphila]
MEPSTMQYDVSRFKTLFVTRDEGQEEISNMVFRSEFYDEELALEREEQELEERNLSNQQSLGGSASFICRHCPEVFFSKKDLTAHRPIHRLKSNKRKPTSGFPCDICDKVFQRRNALADHMNGHNGVRNYPCPECPARFVQRSNRDCHLKSIHLKTYLHSCTEPGCRRRFKQKRERDQHVKTVHRKERNFVCEICTASFSHPINYKKHLASHTAEKQYSCHICGKFFGRPENRDIHLFVHSTSKAYVCSVCGADYMRRNQLIRHSSESGHLNDRIVRQKPQFSPAFARKPFAKDQVPKKSYQEKKAREEITQENLQDAQGEQFVDAEEIPKIFTEEEEPFDQVCIM